MLTYIQLDIYQDLSNTMCLPKDKMKKGKGEDHLGSSIKQKRKVKDRPFAEGSRGCHALLGLDTQNLNVKERHFSTCDMDLYYAVRRFYCFHNKIVSSLFSSH